MPARTGADLHAHCRRVSPVACRPPTCGEARAAVLSLSVPRDTVRQTSLKELWSVAEETAEEHGQTVRREDWHLGVGCHLAESRDEALQDIRVGGAWS